eukprot:5920805-Karenia_brevis.AAC.1
MDSEWTVHGQCLHRHVGLMSAHFCCFLAEFQLDHDPTWSDLAHVCPSSLAFRQNLGSIMAQLGLSV